MAQTAHRSQIPIPSASAHSIQPQAPPSPSAFPSLNGSVTGSATAAAMTAGPAPAAASRLDSATASSGGSTSGIPVFSYAGATKSHIPTDRPTSAALARIQPQSTGPLPKPKPVTPATPAPQATNNSKSSKRNSMPPSARPGNKKGSAGGAGAPINGSKGNGKRTHARAQSLGGSSMRNSGSTSTQYPDARYDGHAMPSYVAHGPLSPRSSKLSPLAPTFDFKPRTPSPPVPIATDNEPTPPQSEHEHLSPVAPAFEPASDTSASTYSIPQTQAETEVTISSAAGAEDETPLPMSAAELNRAEAEVAVVEEQQATVPEAGAVTDTDGTDSKQDLLNKEQPEEKTDVKAETPVEQDVAQPSKETPLPEPLVHAIVEATEVPEAQLSEAKSASSEALEDASREVHDTSEETKSEEVQDHAIIEQTDVKEDVAQVTESTPLPEPLVHATANIAEQKASADEHIVATMDAESAQEEATEEIPTTVEEVVAQLAEKETKHEDPAALVEQAVEEVVPVGEELPLTAEEVVAMPSLDDVLDVDEIPAPAARIEQAVHTVESAQAGEDSSKHKDDALVPKDGTDTPANVEESGEQLSRQSSVSDWEPFEEPADTVNSAQPVEAAPAVAEEEEDDSSTPRPELRDTDLTQEQNQRAETAGETTPATTNTNQAVGSDQAQPVPSTSGPALTRRRSSSPPPPPPQPNRDPNSDEAPSLTLAIVNAWHSASWAKKIPAILASIAINFGLPFVNGVMLGE